MTVLPPALTKSQESGAGGHHGSGTADTWTVYSLQPDLNNVSMRNIATILGAEVTRYLSRDRSAAGFQS